MSKRIFQVQEEPGGVMVVGEIATVNERGHRFNALTGGQISDGNGLTGLGTYMDEDELRSLAPTALEAWRAGDDSALQAFNDRAASANN